MFNRKVLKETAKSKLNGKWGIMVGIYLIFILLIMAESFLSDVNNYIYVIGLFIISPIYLSISKIALNISTLEKSPKISNVLYGFKYILKATGIYIIINIFAVIERIFNTKIIINNIFNIIILLLLIIITTMITIVFGQAIYVLADNNEVGIIDALKESYNLTYGYKWNIFVLKLSFIGLMILSILTLGIGLLWLLPYMEVTNSELYIYLKNEKMKSII